MLWPRRSFRRSTRYFVKRALRLQASPHAIAAGVSAGVFCSFTPFIGLHFILAIILAWLVRGNIVAAALGTAVGNPVTFPFIWGATLQLGKFILRHDAATEVSPDDLGHFLFELEFAKLWEPLLKPMLLGASVLGAVGGVISYFIVLIAARTFREQRRKRLAEQARNRALMQAMEINVAAAE